MNRTGYNSNKKLIIFFTATLLWTWIAGFIPVVLGLRSTSLGTFIFFFGGGAPSVVALFIVFLTYPKEARRDYFKRCISFKRMGWKWPLFTVLFFAVMGAVGIFINTLAGGEMPGLSWLNIAITQPYMIPVLLFFSFISGPLNEEFGWRGYAMDRLLVRFGYVRSSLLLGFIWAIWHLAWFFTPGQAQYEMLNRSLWDAFMYLPSTVALTFVVSFVYIKTNRSILAGAFVHMMSNFLTSQLLSPKTAQLDTIMSYLHVVACCLVALYAVTSKQFKIDFAKTVEQINADTARFDAAGAVKR